MGLQAVQFFFQEHPLCVPAGTVWRRDFTGGWKPPLSLSACSLGVLLQLSKRFLQTLCRMLEIRGEKTVRPLTFNPCFQLNSAACYIFLPGTSSDIHYKMPTSKQKPQWCSWRRIPDQSRRLRGTRSPFLSSASLGAELLLPFVGWILRFKNITLLAKAATEASL